jgi:hypothetical protein
MIAIDSNRVILLEDNRHIEIVNVSNATQEFHMLLSNDQIT